MQLLEEHRDRIRLLLRNAGHSGTRHEVDRLAGAIEGSIETAHSDEADESPFREAHDALRELFRLITHVDPPVGLIRARAAGLPPRAGAYIASRAQRLNQTDFTSAQDFWNWTQSAPAGDLLRFLRLVVADGGLIVAGRKRPGGLRSQPRFEPSIMDVQRRTSSSPAASSNNGRPPATKADRLVMYLAVDWAVVIGEAPEPGRSDQKPFGDLVHQVFGWLKWPRADQALRRYWDAVRQEGARRTRLDG